METVKVFAKKNQVAHITHSSLMVIFKLKYRYYKIYFSEYIFVFTTLLVIMVLLAVINKILKKYCDLNDL